MICRDCRTPSGHAACRERNKNKQGADCDCLHRIKSVEIEKGGEADVLPVVE